MGLAASQARLLLLTGRKSDLEFDSQKIAQARMDLASQLQKLITEKDNQGKNSTEGLNDFEKNFLESGELASSIISCLGPKGMIIGTAMKGITDGIGKFLTFFKGKSSSSGGKNLDAEMAKLHQEDKKLEMKLRQNDTQHNAVQTQYESVQKMIEKNIETSFKMFK